MSGELEALYAKLAAGSAKRPMHPREAALAPLSDWKSTTETMNLWGRKRTATLRLLNRFHAEGILKRRRKPGRRSPFEWRRK